MTSTEIRKRFLEFFREKEHVILDSASLVTTDEKGVTDNTLFNTAGVQPLIPYILAGEHPDGPRLASAQKCVRTIDLDDVGDNTHLTFFEMLGNWSIGDYFKEDAIAYSFEFLTDKEMGLGLDPTRLYVTIFEGDDNAPRDEESYGIWSKIFETAGLDPRRRIFFLPASENWWEAGENGPCGPDTEMFYDVTGLHTNGLSGAEEFLSLSDQKQDLVEIWNDVFMEFEKEKGVIVGKLPEQNVDTGSGLERLTMVIQGRDNVFSTDIFETAFHYMATKVQGVSEESLSGMRSARIIVDHMRSAAFMIIDGVRPSNTGRGYILRRLIRRSVLFARELGLSPGELSHIADSFFEQYQDTYKEWISGRGTVTGEISAEEERFRITLEKGLQQFEKGERDAFVLFTTYGFPLEMTVELAKERGETVDLEGFNEKMQGHQELSRAGAEQKFKGGLADHSEMTVRLHTAHHLLLAALQQVLGPEVKQRGSNITGERLRIDFNFDRKMTLEEKEAVEKIVNEKIREGLNVIRREMPLEEAKSIGAEMEFGAKYPETVSVYFIEDEKGNVFSKEFCGGPHVENTSELGVFKIKKEEASSAGVRRIKATLS